ncbi:ATP-binding protein [Leptolyngbya sp. FACHB-17]|uniref:ATP-binding protein n=1 Tax=unclassified Leptolyngbya TaxID=2650499 RepID=UPI0016801B49|nr:sensor histidine kinase [Leptolyngbya sp. FACHB-17]
MFTKPTSTARSPLNAPTLIRGNTQSIQLESTLKDLPLYDFAAELDVLGTEVARVFEQHSLLPGVILTEQGRFVGMLPRQRLLEYLLRPYGVDLFLDKPLRVLHSYDRAVPLILSGDTPILSAAHQALRRPFERLSDPIVVHLDSDQYRILDVHELNIAYWQLRGIETQVRIERLQLQMVQSEKMASLGRLVDGVSHEILDPVSFIWGNLSHIAEYSRSLLEIIQVYEKYVIQVPQKITDLKEEIEFDYICEDLPKTLDSIRTGAERLSRLANSLQNFCHIDEVYPRPANLHDCLDSVLLLLKSRLTSSIQVVKHYGHLPPIPCFISQLSQVFMNILNRSIDALLNQAARCELESCESPKITILTEVCSLDGSGQRWVSVQISDSNPEISIETQNQLLNAFSTDLAQETSLAMSYRIVTGRHGGKFRVYSSIEPEFRGTVFEILLPLN